MRAVLTIAAALTLSGCPPKTEQRERERTNVPRPCTKFGDNCEYSPGKLGTCIEKENCTAGNCLFCQSQH